VITTETLLSAQARARARDTLRAHTLLFPLGAVSGRLTAGARRGRACRPRR
jgi:hypothetical protein